MRDKQAHNKNHTAMLYILLFPVEFDRKDAEKLENQTFETSADLLAEIQRLSAWNADIKITSLKDFSIFELKDYTTACNDEEVDTDGTWITYVNVNKRMY